MSHLSNSNAMICELLETLPLFYPVTNLVLQGQNVSVTNFISFDSASGTALFFDGSTVRAFDCSEIIGMDM